MATGRPPGSSASLATLVSDQRIRDGLFAALLAVVAALAIRFLSANPQDYLHYSVLGDLTGIDFGDWLGRQPARNRRIAELLAVGERAKDVARWFGLTDARISQLRTGFRRSWQEFQGDADLALSKA